jgi:hypothetical protein
MFYCCKERRGVRVTVIGEVRPIRNTKSLDGTMGHLKPGTYLAFWHFFRPLFRCDILIHRQD